MLPRTCSAARVEVEARARAPVRPEEPLPGLRSRAVPQGGRRVAAAQVAACRGRGRAAPVPRSAARASEAAGGAAFRAAAARPGGVLPARVETRVPRALIVAVIRDRPAAAARRP